MNNSEGQTQEPVGGMKWIDVNDRLPIEERYYHTKGSQICCYWHSDIKKFDLKGVTHWLDENYTPPPSPVGIDVEALAFGKYLAEKGWQPYSKNAWENSDDDTASTESIYKDFKAGYSASLPQSSTEEEKDLIKQLMYFIEEDGKPVDGFRFREIVLELKNKISKR